MYFCSSAFALEFWTSVGLTWPSADIPAATIAVAAKKPSRATKRIPNELHKGLLLEAFFPPADLYSGTAITRI